MDEADVQFAEVLRSTPSFAPYLAVTDHRSFYETLRRHFDDTEAAIATDYLGAWLGADPDAFTRLKSRANATEPPRFTRYVLGRLELRQNNTLSAYEHFRAEAEHPDAWESRYMAVMALAETNDLNALNLLGQDPRFAPYFTPHVMLATAIGERNWSGILQALVEVQLSAYSDTVVIIAIVSAFGWGLFLLHFGEVQSPRSGYFWLCVAGFVLGVISTIPTVFLVIVQDDILHFAPSDDPLRTFAYYIAGVGAREELCKLLLFLPLLPFLIRRDDELEALTVGCFVGLGFAVEENCGYFTMSAAASAPGRFLTANFFHIVLTGAGGLALFRACTRGVATLSPSSPLRFLRTAPTTPCLTSPKSMTPAFWQ